MYSAIKSTKTNINKRLIKKQNSKNNLCETSFIVNKPKKLPIIVNEPLKWKKERLTLNICGRIFEINESVLAKYPSSLLGNQSEREKFYDPLRNEFYFDSSAEAFEGVFYFYHHDYIKCPLFVASEVFYDILDYFRLLEYINQTNCDELMLNLVQQKEEERLDELRKANPIQQFINRYDFKEESEEVTIEEDQRGPIKLYVWNLFDRPYDTVTGRTIGYVCLTTIIISVFQLCLETYVDSIEKPEKINITYFGKQLSLDARSICQNSRLNRDFGKIYPEVRDTCKKLTERRLVFVIVEILCNLIFTLELLLRFFGSIKLQSFFKEISNIIDILIVFPFWTSLLGFSTKNDLANEGGFIKNGLSILRLLRITRVLRILKLSQHLKTLKLIGRILSECIPDILILLTCLFTNIILFSSFIYYIELLALGEKSSFISIPHAFWWAIISFTSIGYGDLIPMSRIGKLFGCIFVLLGMFIALLPVPILSAKFEKLYKELSKASKKKKN